MKKIHQTLSWLDNVFKTKDDSQFILLAALIILVIFTKCYLFIYPKVTAKQTTNTLIQYQSKDLIKDLAQANYPRLDQ